MNTPTRYLIDLETLGTRPGSIILSIGAVKFDRHKVYDEFHICIDPKDCEARGLKADIDTMMWWLKQSEEARNAFLNAPRVPLLRALQRFSFWATTQPDGSAVSDYDSIEVWGNGANFDNVLIKSAYDAVGIHYFGKHYNDRCYRTFKAIHPDIKMQRTGTHHNALDDARSQAEHLISLPTFQYMCDGEEGKAV